MTTLHERNGNGNGYARPRYLCTDPAAVIRRRGDHLFVTCEPGSRLYALFDDPPLCQRLDLDTGWAEATDRTTLIADIEGGLHAVAEVRRMKGGPPPRGVIWFWGDQRYQVGRRKVEVTGREDNVLQAFLDWPRLGKKRLEDRSGEDDPVTVLRRLRKKYDGLFAAVISLPGKKCRGGYSADVRPAPAR
jgi:hypothetical protein